MLKLSSIKKQRQSTVHEHIVKGHRFKSCHELFFILKNSVNLSGDRSTKSLLLCCIQRMYLFFILINTCRNIGRRVSHPSACLPHTIVLYVLAYRVARCLFQYAYVQLLGLCFIYLHVKLGKP